MDRKESKEFRKNIEVDKEDIIDISLLREMKDEIKALKMRCLDRPEIIEEFSNKFQDRYTGKKDIRILAEELINDFMKPVKIVKPIEEKMKDTIIAYRKAYLDEDQYIICSFIADYREKYNKKSGKKYDIEELEKIGSKILEELRKPEKSEDKIIKIGRNEEK